MHTVHRVYYSTRTREGLRTEGRREGEGGRGGGEGERDGVCRDCERELLTACAQRETGNKSLLGQIRLE